MRDLRVCRDEQKVEHSVVDFFRLADSADPTKEPLVLDVLKDGCSQFVHRRECPPQQFVGLIVKVFEAFD